MLRSNHLSGFGVSGADADANAFFAVTGITDVTQTRAVTYLVKDFKRYGLWPLFDFVYPFVGGTAATHKFNLKDPRDLNAAYRGVMNGTITHDANGITPNGSTGYVDTNFNGSTAGRDNDSHLSVYVRTNSAAADKTEISAYNGLSAYWSIKCRDGGDVTFNGVYRFTADGFISVAGNTNSAGFYTLTRRSSSDAESYKNGVSTGNTTTTTQNIPNSNVLIGTRGDHASSFSDRNIAFASGGKGLTDQNAADLYAAVQAYQIRLSRSV